MRWTVHIEGGPMRVNHAAVCIGSKIFSFGGYWSSEEYKDWEPIPVHVLDTATLRWSPVNYKKNDVVPYQRYGHTTVAYGENKVQTFQGFAFQILVILILKSCSMIFFFIEEAPFEEFSPLSTIRKDEGE